jgi:hypothetical protein
MVASLGAFMAAVATSSPAWAVSYYYADVTYVNQTTEPIVTCGAVTTSGLLASANCLPIRAGSADTAGNGCGGDYVVISWQGNPGSIEMGDATIFNAVGQSGAVYTCNPPFYVWPTEPGTPGATVTLTVNITGVPLNSCQTNVTPWSGCLRIANSSSAPQYYQFWLWSGGCSPSSINLGGCSGVSIDGNVQMCGDQTSWFICNPGETHQICVAQVPLTNVVGCTGCSAAPSATLVAVSPSSTFQLCGLTLCQNCAELCNDGMPYFGGVTSNFSANLASNGPPPVTSGVVSNTPSGIQYADGTNNIAFSPDSNDPAQNLTMEQGFSALYDAAGHEIQDLTKLDQDLIAGNAMLAAAISNLASTTPTNTGPRSNYVLNWPSNYPDAVAIGLLGTIATNTARGSNGFDTNLEASASIIASNTAAPLAYTNLGLDAYPTNPASVVAYASNTLAGPISGSLQTYSQSASAAAEAVTVGGSPGSLLTISFELPVVGNYTIDCNPMDNPNVADLAGWFRNLMEWVIGLGFVGLVLRDGMEATRAVFMSPQGQFPKLEILGNSVGWSLAAVYIVALIAALVAVPFAVVTWFSVGATGQMWWQQVAVNPFSGNGVGAAVSLSLWLADQFLPMSYIVSSALYYISFRFALGGIVTVAATIVRALMA